MIIPKCKGCLVPFLAACIICLAGCRESLPEGFAGSGTLEATEVIVSAQTFGTILTLTKEEGDQVAPEEQLARIDVEKLVLQRAELQAGLAALAAEKVAAEAAVAVARENLENAKNQYQRVKTLYSESLATRQDFDDITTRVNVADDQLTEAQARLPLIAARKTQVEASISVMDRQIKDGTVTSPLPGVVVEKYTEPGETALQGGALYKIADLSRFWIKIYLAEADMGRLPIGQKVEVRVDAIPRPLTGTVTWASPEAEFTPKNVQTREARAELVYAVKVTLDDPPGTLKIGMPAEVYFPE